MRFAFLFHLILCASLAPARADASVAPEPIVRLRIVPVEGAYLAYADNLLAGPVEVRLESLAATPLPSQPTLPARASMPAQESTVVAKLQPTAGSSGLAQLRLHGVPGSSNARPKDVLYQLPFQTASATIDQGFEGEFSHQDAENRFALDFALPDGTPVLAARDGVVMQMQMGFTRHGLNYTQDAPRANFIRVLHDDGSMAVYAHLAARSAAVVLGQRVGVGQRLALSGNTGYSTAPHLHFVVQVNRSLQLESIRFRMARLP